MQDKPILHWATQWLSDQYQATAVHHNEVSRTAYSIVYQISSSAGDFYLKQTPKALFIEAAMLDFLNKQGCHNIPKLIATNNDLCCFITASCGDITLKDLFKESGEIQHIEKGIVKFSDIQRHLENKVEPLLTLGALDWRLDKLPNLYGQLLQKTSLLLSDGLTKQELSTLEIYYPKCESLCQRLAKYQLPETISHCDFHANNMLLDQTGDVTILDWGEVAIAHPFFSLNTLLWNMSHFHGLKPSDAVYHQLQKKCVAAWTDFYEEKELLKAFDLANQLLGVYAALAYEQIYRATQNQTKTVSQTHRGAIAGCLRTFIGDRMTDEIN